jgi:penicillin amidase
VAAGGPGRAVNRVGAVAVSALLLGALGFGFGAVPALGPALDPGRGAWTSAAGGQPASSEQLRVPGLTAAVTVSFSAQGLASVSAGDTHDLFLALGYVEARFRLSEMDAERRLGEGRLAQLAGASGLASDEFELRLGLLRTAQQEWARSTGTARAALLAYARGVNDDIAQVRASGDWPALFTLAGQYPRPWTPVDSLVVQGVLTQELDYTTGPLDYALLRNALGPVNTAAWLPAVAANAQAPYDPGPYARLPLTAVPADVASSAPASATTAVRSGSVMSGAAAPDMTEISTSGTAARPVGSGGADAGGAARATSTA